MGARHYNRDSRHFLYYRAIKALETGGDFGRESKGAVQELKAVAGAIHLKPSVTRRFEWIIQDGNVTHRMFIPKGTMNGVPIKP